MISIKKIPATFILQLSLVSPAYAYIGPGIGAGTIATVLGVFGSIVIALIAVLYYPIKRALKKYRKRKHNINNDG